MKAAAMTAPLSPAMQAFLQALEKDEASRNKLTAELQASAEPAQAVVDFAAAMNFVITAEDIATLPVKENAPVGEQPVSDEALDQAGGGIIFGMMAIVVLIIDQIRINKR